MISTILISTIRRIQDELNIILTLESFMSLESQDDILNVISSFRSHSNEKTSMVDLNATKEDFQQVLNLKKQFPLINYSLCECVLDKVYSEYNPEVADDHNLWINKCRKFLTSKAYPHEFVFVSEYGLSKIEEVNFQGKQKAKETIINNTILEMRNSLISSIKEVAIDQEFILNNLI